jgi:hypothetical protein
MYEYLQAGDGERFAILASAYEVRYVVAIGNSQFAFHDLPLELAFADEGVTIYAVTLPSPARVNLGGKAEFLGSAISWRRDGSAQIELYLRCIKQMEGDYTLWFHADAEGQTITLDHELPSPTSGWTVGQIVRDVFVLDLPAGRYDLSFGLWMWQDGRRLWRMDNGEPGIALGSVQLGER